MRRDSIRDELVMGPTKKRAAVEPRTEPRGAGVFSGILLQISSSREFERGRPTGGRVLRDAATIEAVGLKKRAQRRRRGSFLEIRGNSFKAPPFAEADTGGELHLFLIRATGQRGQELLGPITGERPSLRSSAGFLAESTRSIQKLIAIRAATGREAPMISCANGWMEFPTMSS